MYCDKRNQKHRKGKGDPPSLFHSFPFDKWGAWQTFRYAQGLQQLQDRKETKKYRLTKTETKKVCRDFHVK